MKELTYKNHFKYAYNGENFTFRKNPDDIWSISFGKCERPVLDFKTECLKAAEYICNNTNLPIIIMFSGGIDSEIILRTFLEIGAEVTAVTLQLNNNLNYHDIKYAIEVCEELKAPHKIFQLDIFDFFQNMLPYYIEHIAPILPVYCVMLWLIDQLDGQYVITGNGVLPIIRHNDLLYLVEKELYLVISRYCILNNLEGAPEFFHYSPEMMLSYLNEVVNILKTSTIPASVLIKYDIYKKFWPDIKQRKKYTGFEKLVWFNLYYIKKYYYKSDHHMISLEKIFKEKGFK